MLSQVEKDYVRTGKVELIYLDFPLQIPSNASKAAEAAACAGDQGKFWEMRQRLFANQNALAPDRLPGHAKAVGLEAAAFQQCLASGRQMAGIRQDVRAVQILGIGGTPAYLLGRRIPGGDKVQVLDVINGLAPYEVFKEKLDALLAAN